MRNRKMKRDLRKNVCANCGARLRPVGLLYAPCDCADAEERPKTGKKGQRKKRYHSRPGR